MVIKIYISGISGNKEVKKRQQRVMMILDSKNVDYQVIDITEPGREAEKEYMQMNSVARESKYPLPPQIFNDEDYCGDYENFDEANEMDELDKFLKGPTLSSEEPSNEKSENNEIHQNGNASSREQSTDKEALSEIINSTEDTHQSDKEKESESKDFEPQECDLEEDEDDNKNELSDHQDDEE